MSIVEITDKAREPWDTFVKAYAPDGGLLQSWGWGEVQKALGNPVFRLAVLDEQGQFRAALLLVRHELHFEYNYLYAPRGPVMDTLNAHELSELLGAVKRRGSWAPSRCWPRAVCARARASCSRSVTSSCRSPIHPMRSSRR